MQDKLAELRLAADYHLLRRQLTPLGWFSLSVGVLQVIFGVVAPVRIGTWVLPTVGALMIIQGIWLIRAPSPVMFLIEGVVLTGAIASNLMLRVGAQTGRGPHPYWIFAIIAVFWLYDSIRKIRRFTRLRELDHSSDVVEEMRRLLRDMDKGSLKSRKDLIQFDAYHQKWRVEFLDDAVLMVASRQADCVIVGIDEFTLTDRGRALLRNARKVAVRAGGRGWNGLIDPEHIKRYEKWKSRIS